MVYMYMYYIVHTKIDFCAFKLFELSHDCLRKCFVGVVWQSWIIVSWLCKVSFFLCLGNTRRSNCTSKSITTTEQIFFCLFCPYGQDLLASYTSTCSHECHLSFECLIFCIFLNCINQYKKRANKGPPICTPIVQLLYSIHIHTVRNNHSTVMVPPFFDDSHICMQMTCTHSICTR